MNSLERVILRVQEEKNFRAAFLKSSRFMYLQYEREEVVQQSLSIQAHMGDPSMILSFASTTRQESSVPTGMVPKCMASNVQFDFLQHKGRPMYNKVGPTILYT